MIRTILSHRYFKNASWLMADKVYRLAVGFIVMSFLARHLGPEEFGLYTYIQTFTLLFYGLYSFGIDGVLVKHLLSPKYNTEDTLRTALSLKIIASFIGSTVVILSAQLLNDESVKLPIILLSISLIFQSTNVFDYHFQARVLGKKSALAQSSAFTISSAVKLIAIWQSADLFTLSLLLSVDALVLSAAFIIAFIKSEGYFPALKIDRQIARDLLSQSWPLIFSSTAVLLQARVDQIMLKSLAPASELGFYAVALLCIEAAAFPAAIMKQALTPAVVNAKNNDHSIYLERMTNLYRLSFLFFFASAAAVVSLSEIGIEIFFGAAFAPAATLLSIYSFRLFFSYATIARSTYVMIENLLPYALFTLIFGTLINVVANYYLIPALHAKGAILATLISFSVPIFVLDIFHKKMHTNTRTMIKALLSPHKVSLR